MWLTIGSRPYEDAVELVLPELAALALFADELGRRLGHDGFDGLSELASLHGRLRTLLAAIPNGDLERAHAALGELVAALEDAARRLERLAQLKRAVGA
jgi:hypothetical protein